MAIEEETIYKCKKPAFYFGGLLFIYDDTYTYQLKKLVVRANSGDPESSLGDDPASNRVRLLQNLR